jgi:uncharacterized protein (TIGR03437 family)
MLFGTGGGQTDPPSVAGPTTPPRLQPLTAATEVEVAYSGNPPTATRITLNIEYAGAAPGLVAGVTQINIMLPETIPASPFFATGIMPLWVLTNRQLFDYETVSIFVATD